MNPITGVEIDLVVRDSLVALALYERIFEVERIEVSNFPKGTNEAVFSIYGARIHLLDENPDYGLTAPQPGQPLPSWLNVLVPDIKAAWDAAIEAGCNQIQPVTEMAQMGVSNAVFSDPDGHVWMLHQIHRVVSHAERVRILEKEFGPADTQAEAEE